MKTLWGIMMSLALVSCDQAGPLTFQTKPVVENLDKLSAEPGETVIVTGKSLTAEIEAYLGDSKLNWTLASPVSASLMIPSEATREMTKITFIFSGETISEIPLLIGDLKKGASLDLEAKDVCSDVLYTNSSGELVRGTRTCTVEKKECAATGEEDCLTTKDYPAIGTTELKTKIVEGLTFAGVSGTYQCPVLPICSASNQSACRIEGTEVLALKVSDINASDIRDQVVIAGVTGTLVESTATVCNTDGQVSCVTSANFPAIDKTVKLTPTNLSKIHDSITLAGEQGTLSSCAANASNCLLATYNGTTETLKAIEATAITSGVIKKNTVIGGVTGDYPSATYPLPGVDATLDLVSSTLSSQLSNGAASFAWYDREGARYTSLGSSDLAAGNILDGKTIFGIGGTVELPDPWDVRAGVALGGSSSGKLITNCKPPAQLATINYGKPIATSWVDASDILTTPDYTFMDNDPIRLSHGGSGFNLNDRNTYYIINQSGTSYQISNSVAGAVEGLNGNKTDVYVHRIVPGVPDQWDNLYPYTSIAENPWGSPQDVCGSLETVAGDDSVWKDVSSADQCTNGGDCRLKDKITGLTWTKVVDSLVYSPGVLRCDHLTYDGVTGWRLPTYLELVTATVHGMSLVARTHWITSAQIDTKIMSSTTNAEDDVQYLTYIPKSLTTGKDWKTTFTSNIVCVKD